MLIPGFWFNLQDNSFPLKGIRKTTEEREKIIHIVGISVTTISFSPPII